MKYLKKITIQIFYKIFKINPRIFRSKNVIQNDESYHDYLSLGEYDLIESEDQLSLIRKPRFSSPSEKKAVVHDDLDLLKSSQSSPDLSRFQEYQESSPIPRHVYRTGDFK